jgi:hypothetical protein
VNATYLRSSATVLIHQYFGVDYVTLWNIVAKECPAYCTVRAALPECSQLPENLDHRLDRQSAKRGVLETGCGCARMAKVVFTSCSGCFPIPITHE